jgi:hypothetical protein
VEWRCYFLSSSSKEIVSSFQREKKNNNLSSLGERRKKVGIRRSNFLRNGIAKLNLKKRK